MAEYGEVISKEGNKVRLKLYKNEACKNCGACDLGSGGKMVEILAINKCGADVGDTVELFIKKEKFLSAVGIMYVYPLVALLLGIGLGYLINYLFGYNSELLVVAVGLGLTLVAFLSIKKLDKGRKLDVKYTPLATKVIK